MSHVPRHPLTVPTCGLKLNFEAPHLGDVGLDDRETNLTDEKIEWSTCFSFLSFPSSSNNDKKRNPKRKEMKRREMKIVVVYIS